MKRPFEMGAETESRDIVAELDDLLRWFDEPAEVLATIRRARDEIVRLREASDDR